MKVVKFRDGKREIPDHLAAMMVGLETKAITYEQAVEKANWKMASDHLNHAQDTIIQGHFREGRGG